MIVLGISCFYHDAAACLVKDGKIVAAAEEERFSRKKHDVRFPEKAIEYCLEEAGIRINEVDYIGFYEKPMIKFERLMSQHMQMFPRSLRAFIEATPSWLSEKLKVSSVIQKKLKYKGEILFIEHHLAHAASAFLPSPFRKAAILTVDGVGEWATTTIALGEGNKIRITKEIHFPHSLGLLYSTVTAYLGFKVNNDEYKVMGLAAYGEPKYCDDMKKLIDVKEDGSFSLDMSYFDYHYKLTMPGKKFMKLFGSPRKPEGEISQRHKDIAASLQKLTEDTLLKILNNLNKETRVKNLCMAGGVALNSVTNGKILKNTGFGNIYIQPAASDAGGSLGVALYIYNTLLKNKKRPVMDSCYLGPSFSKSYIRNFLDKLGINYKEFRNRKSLLKATAALIERNQVVGWFQGRMEWGPRALGNRSILANPCSDKMKDILNAKVKHREMFRPFAPVILADRVRQYFESDNPLPLPSDFMLMVYPIKKNKRSKIPAVTHVDGSGRLQTIRRHQNPLYYDLIKEFGKLTGVPILVNTSFNIRGEPIVCRPEEAYRCMMGTGIDYLVIDEFIIPRKDNPKDMWDSERHAKD